MSVHPNDRIVLQRLIRLADAILARPETALVLQGDVAMLAADVDAAIRCPAHKPFIGAAEQIVALSLAQIALGLMSQVDFYRFAQAAKTMLPMVREHLFAAVVAEGTAR